MTKETRQMLNTIDEFLLRCDVSSGELWDVLTALRGPDDNKWTNYEDGTYDSTKDVTTLPIRIAAFPKSAGDKNLQARWTCSWYCLPMFVIPITDARMTHFNIHAEAAAKVLGI